MKQCTKCGRHKPESKFSWRNKAKNKKHVRCKECQKLYSKAHRKHYVDPHLGERKRRYLQRNRKFVARFLKEHPCVDCGENNIVILTFDHVRGKKSFTISEALTRDVCSIQTLGVEIEKCEIRCFNCHNKKTALEQKWWILEHI